MTPCAVPGCPTPAVATHTEETDGKVVVRHLCRAHWRQLLRARALMHIAIRAGYERGEKP